MAYESTESFYRVENDIIGARADMSGYGPNDDDAFKASRSDYRLWVDNGGAVGDWQRRIEGQMIVDPDTLTWPRITRLDVVEDFTDDEVRADKLADMEQQVPEVTVTDEVKQPTIRASVDQITLRLGAGKEELARTTDPVALRAFDTSLTSYDSTEAKYAGSLLMQALEKRVLHDKLFEVDGIGLYDTAELADVDKIILDNSGTRRGTRTGITVPSTGAPREDITLDGEESEVAVFDEIQYDWNTQAQYIPICKIETMPASVDPAQVFMTVYDGANNWRGWIPFVQQADGSWSSDSENVSYISIAQTQSSKWRCAVALNASSSENEVTRRVYLIPPNAETATIRVGGRNGAGVSARGKGRR